MYHYLHCFNIMAIGGYFAFIIFVMGTILDARHFTYEEKQQIFQKILESHNEYRKLHDSSKLELKKHLCEIAKTRLNEWIAKKPNTLSNEYGANYFHVMFKDNSVVDTDMIVASWYKYENDYNYSEKLSSPNLTDPFTQLVWQKTKEIGVEILVKMKTLHVIVIYFPAGNIPGQYMSNVKDPRELARQKAELGNTTGE